MDWLVGFSPFSWVTWGGLGIFLCRRKLAPLFLLSSTNLMIADFVLTAVRSLYISWASLAPVNNTEITINNISIKVSDYSSSSHHCLKEYFQMWTYVLLSEKTIVCLIFDEISSFWEFFHFYACEPFRCINYAIYRIFVVNHKSDDWIYCSSFQNSVINHVEIDMDGYFLLSSNCLI